MHFPGAWSTIQTMNRCSIPNLLRAHSRIASTLVCISLLAAASLRPAAAEPTPAATSAFDSYIGNLEQRLATQHQAADGFLAPLFQSEARLRKGDLMIQELSPSGGQQLTGALLHDWRGTAFVPGAHASDFERLMKDFAAYPQHFAPQVLKASAAAQSADHIQATMRVRQQHILTVVMDTSYDVTFARLDAEHGYSLSRSTHIAEIDSPGSTHEHAFDAQHEHGFLWRLNTYWTYEERDNGLYIQIESVSLTRAIPTGLAWAIGPFIESIPRDSLEFTLRSTCTALRR